MPASRQYGYFTEALVESPCYALIRDGSIWMTTSRMERESHAFHLDAAKGRVIVCGVGMGMYLYNLCVCDRVREIVAIDIDPAIIHLVQTAADFAAWPGREKIRFVQADEKQLTLDHIGPDPVDHLYVDIWPGLGWEDAPPDTRQIQSIVHAKQVGYWGQEVDFGKWHAKRRATGRPSMLEGDEFVRWTRLPLGRLSLAYLEAACLATTIYGRKAREHAALLQKMLDPSQKMQNAK